MPSVKEFLHKVLSLGGGGCLFTSVKYNYKTLLSNGFLEVA